MERDGQQIPAVGQVTKSGHVFVFNRLTGEPLFPIEEKEFPPSNLEGELAAKTQPIPTKPAPFARQLLTREDLYTPERPAFVEDFVDKAQNINPPTIGEKFDGLISNGQFMPVDTIGTIIFPGTDGGAEWGGAALDPRSNVLYVNSNEMAWIVRMRRGKEGDYAQKHPGVSLTQLHCTRCHGGNLQGIAGMPELQTVKDRIDVDSITSIIKNGRGAMPGNPHLSKYEVDAIANYIAGIEMEKDHRAEANLNHVPYATAGFGRFKDDRGFPAVKPPWGTLNAIDLDTGDYLWKIPLGHEEELNDPNIPVSGTENYGGPVISEGGVLFIAATRDEKIRAFHMQTGEQLWEDKLPAAGYATPATYQVNGKQYMVIACGGGKIGTKSGDEYRAYALPDL